MKREEKNCTHKSRHGDDAFDFMGYCRVCGNLVGEKKPPRPDYRRLKWGQEAISRNIERKFRKMYA